MIGIVIVSFRSDDRTVAFVREELSRIRIPYRLVVVDNGGSKDSNLKDRLPDATVLRAENKGYAAGCNLGARWLREHVDPDAILFSNNDIRFQSDDVVDALYTELFRHDDVGAIGPCIVGKDGRRQSPEPYQGLWNRYVWMYLLTPFLSLERKVEKFRLDYSEKASEGYHY